MVIILTRNPREAVCDDDDCGRESELWLVQLLSSHLSRQLIKPRKAWCIFASFSDIIVGQVIEVYYS